MQNETKQCQNCHQDFIIEPDDFGFYEKMNVPAPTFCSQCRFQRRAVYRNERKLFKVKDAFTGKDLFSLYPPTDNYKIITHEEWFSDSWDGMNYGRDYDFSHPFFEQIFELNHDVPIYNLNVERPINSPYSGNATGVKNCYLLFNSNYSEDCMYGNAIDHCKDCVDNSHINHSERCYESFWLQNCYQCYFTIMSVDSRNLWFCRDCLGCNDCFGCANLRKFSYCIFNQQYSKEEYQQKIKEMKLNTISELKKNYEPVIDFWNTQLTKFHQGLQNLNSTGSYVSNCKNVKDSYLIRESENLRFCQYMQVPGNKDCYDATIWGEKTELCYETIECGENSYNNLFCWDCWPNVRNSQYCMHLKSCSDCFGCIGLKSKQYCVFNKQYTKEEYFDLVEKIKEQMNQVPYIDKQGIVYKYGEFFPIELAPRGYNNSIAIQHFPLTEEEALKKGYKWVEIPFGEYKITKKVSEIPDAIENVSGNFINEIIECSICHKAYRILENELNFLRKENLPLPDRCHDCRYERRINHRLKTLLYDRECMCAGEKDQTGKYKNNTTHLHGNNPCNETFKTGYAPTRPEIVYCESCYQQEVY